MQNQKLGIDYVQRAEIRIFAIEVLFEKQSWADVVRESQEVVELALKGCLRILHVDFPRTHDVSDTLLANRDIVPVILINRLEKLAEISRALRRDRELAFYGGEDFTPSEFYKENDAKVALENARWVVQSVKLVLP